eukprot:2939309-Amphidinium_carterae.1
MHQTKPRDEAAVATGPVHLAFALGRSMLSPMPENRRLLQADSPLHLRGHASASLRTSIEPFSTLGCRFPWLLVGLAFLVVEFGRKTWSGVSGWHRAGKASWCPRLLLPLLFSALGPLALLEPLLCCRRFSLLAPTRALKASKAEEDAKGVAGEGFGTAREPLG